MATIKNVLTLEDRMTSTFQSVEKAAKHAEKTFMQISKRLDELDGKSKKVSSSTGSIFKGMLGANLVSKGISMITSQLDSAIKRFDTINNYQNVMAGLGFDNEASQKSIDRLKDGLEGLPTTLDDAVSSVQRFAAVNENIRASTEITLALNDALAAGGTPAASQAAALEQISQAYAKGKFDAMEYKSMMNAMPAQLKQVAQSMGYTSTALGGDFYTALQKGKIGMNDLMKKMVELDHTTGGFHDQALNATKGIGTAFTNMKTAITKGLADIIEKINDALTKANLPTIDKMITKVGKTIQKMLSAIGTYIRKLISMLTPIINIVKTIVQFVKDNWSIIEPIIQAIIIVLGVYYTYTLLASIGTRILSAAMEALTNPMFWIMIAIIAVVAILIYLWNTNDDVAYWMLYAWDALRLGAMLLWLGIKTAFYSIVIVALYMYEGILGVKLGIQTAFYALKLGALSLKLGFETVCQGIVNAFIWMYNKVVELLNKLGAHFNTMDYADFTSGTVDAIGETMTDYANAVAKTYGEMEDVASKITDYQDKLSDTAIKDTNKIIGAASTYEATRNDRVANRKQLTLGNTIKSAANDAAGVLATNWNNMANNINAATGTDGSGGKAIKTTTNDDLLKDEDIQLLLDVATRDYKLNYQQVTPQITMTFGDIRENADVDVIADQLAERLQEIVDGNLEVQPA